MKIKNCLIIEDDLAFVEVLKDYIGKIPFIEVAGHCSNYSEAVAFLLSNQVDFILLDILLNDAANLTGFDLLRTQQNMPPTIIISSSPTFAVESYNIGMAKDFLAKPFDFNRFLLAIGRVLGRQLDNKLLTDDTSIFLKMGRRFQRFELDDIDYIEAYGIYAKVISLGETHVVNDIISNLEECLDARMFRRVHKSYIVNLTKITGFDHNNLFLQKGSVPIGISYKPKLEELLQLFKNEELN